MQQATFGAGCFWGVEERYRNMNGVAETAVGFMGGAAENPSYQQVCYENTGHAEVCHVTFDPDEVSYEQLLDAFWGMHNPTTLNRQGPDVGSQYRSAVFYHDDDQREKAQLAKEKWQSKYPKPIVTEITPAGTFYPAEEYHQRYLEKRGMGSCHL